MTQTVELNIEGMTCADCVRQVTDALNNLPGVQVLEVGLGTAKIGVEDVANEPAALDAIRKAGYEPTKA